MSLSRRWRTSLLYTTHGNNSWLLLLLLLLQMLSLLLPLISQQHHTTTYFIFRFCLTGWSDPMLTLSVADMIMRTHTSSNLTYSPGVVNNMYSRKDRTYSQSLLGVSTCRDCQLPAYAAIFRVSLSQRSVLLPPMLLSADPDHRRRQPVCHSQLNLGLKIPRRDMKQLKQ